MIVCEKTWLLAQRLAIVSALPETGSVVVCESSRDMLHYSSIILAHRGRDVASATLLRLGDHPFPWCARGKPVFTDPAVRARAERRAQLGAPDKSHPISSVSR